LRESFFLVLDCNVYLSKGKIDVSQRIKEEQTKPQVQELTSIGGFELRGRTAIAVNPVVPDLAQSIAVVGG
jgi:hypothetical protein